jgi:hypothetical protein
MEVKALTLAQELNQNTLITLPWVVGVTLTLSPIMEASYLLTIWLSPQLDTKREVHPLSFSSTNLTSRSLSHQERMLLASDIMVMEPVVIHICWETMVASCATIQEKIKLSEISTKACVRAACPRQWTPKIQVQCITRQRIGSLLKPSVSSRNVLCSSSLLQIDCPHLKGK